ncbi:MAG: threonine aldolase [Alphaproteobacteria bacterium]|nr:threonine aldolase [Alphaproteobacteria bacterium]
MIQSLMDKCHTHFYQHKNVSAAELFTKISEFCEANGVDIDRYGEGEFIQKFEQKIADLLGFEKAVFFATGTMAQSTALQIACDKRRNHIVAMHPSCHIFKHERQGYQIYNRFKILPLGTAYATWNKADLEAWPDEISACVYELPMRVLGGQLPSWDELQELKEHCAEQDIHFHMDGARLWEAAAYYGKSYAQIAAGFDSVYVSLYKGVGGLGGSMLLGDEKMIDMATVALQRQGANLYTRLPYIASAAMNFDDKIALMPRYFERTKQIYKMLAGYEKIKLNPPAPQANMFHMHLPVSSERATEIRDKIAEQYGVWMFGGVEDTELENNCKREWYVGDALLNLPDDEFLKVMDYFYQELTILSA